MYGKQHARGISEHRSEQCCTVGMGTSQLKTQGIGDPTDWYTQRVVANIQKIEQFWRKD